MGKRVKSMIVPRIPADTDLSWLAAHPKAPRWWVEWAQDVLDLRKKHPRANRISAAERRVVEAALLAAKHCRKYGTVTLDELMAAVEKLERAKGGANG